MLPSGNQLALSRDGVQATVAQVGASLRSLSHDGVEIVANYVAGEVAFYGEGQVLVPWPSRIQDGAYELGGTTHQLALSEPAQHNAIHGLARWLPWEVVSADAEHARLSLQLHPQGGYPFGLSVEVTYALSDAGLRVETTARNAGDQPLPYGCGFHPYLSLGCATVSELVVAVPADAHLPVDERGIPTGERVPVAGTELDLRAPQALGDRRLDTIFGDLQRDESGRATVSLGSPQHDGVRLWLDAQHPYLMLYSGDTLPEGKRRRSLAVEPMTCAPNAFRTGDGLIVLAPGESHVSRWGIDLGA